MLSVGGSEENEGRIFLAKKDEDTMREDDKSEEKENKGMKMEMVGDDNQASLCSSISINKGNEDNNVQKELEMKSDSKKEEDKMHIAEEVNMIPVYSDGSKISTRSKEGALDIESRQIASSSFLPSLFISNSFCTLLSSLPLFIEMELHNNP